MTKIEPAAKSLFPLKLILLYILFVGTIPTINFVLEFGNLEETEADWNWTLRWSLILAPLLFGACLVAGWNFRRMPLTTSVLVAFTAFHLWSTLALYFSDGFISSPLEYNLDAVGFAGGVAVFALPFVAVYLGWRFWPRARSIA